MLNPSQFYKGAEWVLEDNCWLKILLKFSTKRIPIFLRVWVSDTIKNDKIKITKLAQGLPVGGEIEQLDDGTLFSAFKNRLPVTDN